ncbi:MAG: methyltransferase domain-containing protein [Anaerolineae bacterium]|nr:methyltransferase domain-containing protein [Anaerolineae bacterium]
MHNSAALPLPEQLVLQAQWLAPARSRMLRENGIGRRQCVLDLGAAYGAVTAELVRRAGGRVVALDRELTTLTNPQGTFADALRTGGEARALPFATASFDLVLSQCTLLWVAPLESAIQEVTRVLQPGGAFLALEPDYDGLMESPPSIETRTLWLEALSRAGANPTVGRRLPGLLAAQGLQMRVALFDSLVPPAVERFGFLRGLPLTSKERERLSQVEQQAQALDKPWAQVAHLPFFLITAVKP